DAPSGHFEAGRSLPPNFAIAFGGFGRSSDILLDPAGYGPAGQGLRRGNGASAGEFQAGDGRAGFASPVWPAATNEGYLAVRSAVVRQRQEVASISQVGRAQRQTEQSEPRYHPGARYDAGKAESQCKGPGASALPQLERRNAPLSRSARAVAASQLGRSVRQA